MAEGRRQSGLVANGRYTTAASTQADPATLEPSKPLPGATQGGDDINHPSQEAVRMLRARQASEAQAQFASRGESSS